MRDALIYTMLFLTAIVLQLFVFDSLHLGFYVAPLVYISFVALLPMNARPVVVLLLGLLMGVAMDFFTGMGGLHTAVTIFTAYIRQFLMTVILGKESMDEGGMPSVKTLGRGKFVRYAAFMAGIHCLCFFSLESLNWKYYYLTLLKTVLSGGITLVFVWLISLLFTLRVRKKA